MANLRYAAIRGMFEVLAVTRLTAILRRLSRARGIIFTLHRVLPDESYFHELSEQWSEALKSAAASIPQPPYREAAGRA